MEEIESKQQTNLAVERLRIIRILPWSIDKFLQMTGLKNENILDESFRCGETFLSDLIKTNTGYPAFKVDYMANWGVFLDESYFIDDYSELEPKRDYKKDGQVVVEKDGSIEMIKVHSFMHVSDPEHTPLNTHLILNGRLYYVDKYEIERMIFPSKEWSTKSLEEYEKEIDNTWKTIHFTGTSIKLGPCKGLDGLVQYNQQKALPAPKKS